MLNNQQIMLQNLVSGINADQGTVNCAHCALRFDEHLAAGKNLNLGSVPTETASMYSHPLFKAGKIKRSTTKDKRLIARASPALVGYREICSVDDPNPVYEIDLTPQNPSEEIRFVTANQDNIEKLLQLLPRRKKDGTAYGFILLTHEKNPEKGHIINFYVDDHDQVYFIDAQRKNPREQITQQLNMKGYRSEIFYLQSNPPEGFIPIIKKEKNSYIKPEKENISMLDSTKITVISPFVVHPDKAQENFNNLLKLTSGKSSNANSLVWLGYSYFNAIGTQSDHEKAFNCLKKAVDIDPQSVYAWNLLGEYYLRVHPEEKRNLEEAYKSFVKATVANDKATIPWRNLGLCYKMGLGTKTNPENAFKCYKKAADLGSKDIDVWKNLIECYQKGLGTEVNLEKVTWCQQNLVKFENQKQVMEFEQILTRTKSLSATAKDFGDIGDRYTIGMGTQKNPEEGFRCYRKAIELDNKYGKVWNNLGVCYKHGGGIAVNPLQAFLCFRNATKTNGGAVAWFNLYLCYEQGFGTLVNHQEAMKCAVNAANLDNKDMPLVKMPSVTNSPLLFNANRLPSLTVNPAPSPVSVVPLPTTTPVNGTSSVLETQLKLKEEEVKLLRKQLALKDRELDLKNEENALLLESLGHAKRVHDAQENASKKQKLG